MTKDKCRICLQKGIMQNIFVEWRSRIISEILMSLSNVQIYPEDGLPSTICKKCLKNLDNCLDFIQLCENSDSKLRTLQEKLSADIEVASELYSKSASDDEIKLESDINGTIPSEDTKRSELEQENIKFCKKSSKQQCFTCGKIMSSRFRLKTHQKIHSGERQFACPHCSKTFSLAEYLKVHLRRHTGEKPFKCAECDALFAHASGLAAHMRKHTGQLPYRCVLCPQQFRTFGHLQYHLRRHTGEKNFECDTCGRAFITRSQLKQHLASHSGERPHVCCVCGMRLSRAEHLRRHMSHVHNSQRRSRDTTKSSKSPKKICSRSQSRSPTNASKS